MKYFYNLLLLSFFTNSLCALTKEEREYLKKYPAPLRVRGIFDKATNNGKESFSELIDQTFGCSSESIFKIRDVLDLFIKQKLDRLDGAADLNKVFLEEKLNLLFVPNKYAYENQKSVWVIAERVIDAGVHGGVINLPHMQQLVRLAKTNAAKGPTKKPITLIFMTAT